MLSWHTYIHIYIVRGDTQKKQKADGEIWEEWECGIWEEWECDIWEEWECDIWEEWECDIWGRMGE